MKIRMKLAVIILMMGMITTIYCQTCCAQNEKDIAKVNKQFLCILEETENNIVYLTNLTRIVQNIDDESIYYAGGDEVFLRYEILTLSKYDEKISTLNYAILYCKPERIAMPDGRNYDTIAFYMLPESSISNEKESSVPQIEIQNKWINAGLGDDEGLSDKILEYYENHRDIISVCQEDLDRYKSNY